MSSSNAHTDFRFGCKPEDYGTNCAPFEPPAIAAIDAQAPPTVTGGSPEHLSQDQDRGLSQWLASKPDARLRVREACADIAAQQAAPASRDAFALNCDITPIEPRPLAYSLRDYHRAGVDGPLHYTWTDKPHRLLYDLIAAVRFYAARATPTEQAAPVALTPLTDEQIKEAITVGVQSGKVAWLGYEKDADGKYTLPSLSLQHYQIARAVLAAAGAAAQGGEHG